MTSEALGDAIVKKQYIECIKKIDSFLKKRPEIAIKVWHLMETGVFEAKDNLDMILPSTNKFRLLSMDVIKSLLMDAYTPEELATNGLSDKLDNIKNKTVGLKLLCYLGRFSDSCPLPSRQVKRLKELVWIRVNDTPARRARIQFEEVAKGKGTGTVVEYNEAVFKLDSYSEEESKHTSIVHVDSGLKVPIWDEIKVARTTRINDNWNELSAYIKVHTVIHAAQFFKKVSASQGDDSKQEVEYGDLPLPFEDEVIPERLSSKGGVASSSSRGDDPAPNKKRHLSRRASAEFAAGADSSATPPPGWGGAQATS